jgi:Tfp pilus assembly protein PilO
MSRRAPLIAGILFVVLAALAAALLVIPKMGEVTDAEESLQQAQEQEVVLQAELSRLQAAEENLPELRRELARFRRAVPPVADLPGLINELQTAADVAGVDFFLVAPGAPAPAPGAGAVEIPAQIQVIGGFFAVDEFLFRLETLPRAAKVVGITIGPGAEGLPQIQIEMDARFYTTDTEAGPGAAAPATPEEAEPTPSPSPGESPATPTPATPTPAAAAAPEV